MKRALVTGGGGFVGGHLVRRLKADGYWVRAADRVDPKYGATSGDDFVRVDLHLPGHAAGSARADRGRRLPGTARQRVRLGEALRRADRPGVRTALRVHGAPRAFQNCYGPRGAWRGGREKSPAAICRKVAEVDDGGTIEVWGDGTAVRSFIYVDDLVEGVVRLMHSDIDGPVNIGTREYVTVRQLVDTVAAVAGKQIEVRWVEGPVGVRFRNFSNDRIESLGRTPTYSLGDGIALTNPWVET